MMNSHSHQRQKREGGVLAIALVMTMLGGIVMASWVTIGFARSMQAASAEQAVKRRLSLGNSKALTRQFGHEQLFQSGNSIAGNLTDALGSGSWGSMNTDSGFLNIQPFGNHPETGYPLPGYMDLVFPYEIDTVFPYNHTGLRPGPSFISTHRLIRAPLDDSIDPYNHFVFVKAASPLASGDALTFYQKPAGVTAEIQAAVNMQVRGRLVVRDPRSFFPLDYANLGQKRRLLIRSGSFYVQKHDERNLMTGTSLSNSEITSINLPAMPSTNGYSDSLDMPSAYEGQLNVVNNPGNPRNSLYHKQQEEFDSGTTPLLVLNSPLPYGSAADPVQIIQYNALGEPPVAVKPPGYPSGYPIPWTIAYIRLGHASLPNIRITDAVHQVVFDGQDSSAAYNAAANMEPRIILIQSSSSAFPRLIYFRKENRRSILLGVKHSATSATLDLRWVGPVTPGVADGMTLDWRLYFINESRPCMNYMPTGSLRVAITGGVMTNWSFLRSDAGASDQFTLTPVWNPSYRLASLLPKDAWLESYFTLVEP